MPAAVGADAHREEHEAELRDGRVRQHLLDVVLDQRDRAGQDRRGDADDRDHLHGDRRLAKSTALRPTMYTPAVTIVAAWIRAETGVGPSIASGSQT
jgi:hypothetical protein